MIITLKDGSTKEYSQPMSVIDIAKDISEGLARAACVAEVNGETVDLRTVIDKDSTLNLFTFDSPEGQHAFNHTASHMMAQAIKRLYPEVKLAIGPSIDHGFYYDIESEKQMTNEDLEKIEAEMKKIAKENLALTRFTKPRDEAIAYFREKEEPYKVQLIEDLPEDAEISFYTQGEFTDLCAGPHLMTTKPVKAFKLTSIAGAYWRGDEHNKMLTRIYGTAFPKKSELDEYLARIEEAKKRDHRKIGKEMGLFMLSEYGPGMPFFLPNGMLLRNELLNYWRKLHLKNGYVQIDTPIMLSRKLWETSGHWDHYKDGMYSLKVDEEDYAIKPMNCPGAILVYQNEGRSYRDLPLRYAELGHVHRYEKSGELHGLMRVRSFTQDDAHIFMLPEQVKGELKDIIKLIDDIYSVFGFSYKVVLATRPQNAIGSAEDWTRAQDALKEAVEDLGIEYDIAPGGGAFYGPKLDFHLRDCIGRTWQCGTVQLDFQMPQRFDLTYTGADGEKHRPVMIHRTVFGSIERFMGVLIEHFEGKLPLWLAPVQVKIISVSEKHNETAWKLADEIEAAGLRTEVDARNEKTGYKVREAILARDSYIIVVGEKEATSDMLTVRSSKAGDMGEFPKTEFIAMLQKEIAEKAL